MRRTAEFLRRETLRLYLHGSFGFAELLYNGLGQSFVNLTVAGDRLRFLGFWVGVPIVARTVADQHTTELLQRADEVAPFQSVNTNSSTLRMYGMSPD